ncbi:low-affinity phosphate transporter [Aspergillus alliaceus]|uniref:Small ribosomal subunit protein uS7m n=1 Tax=Petromyces alliaceus TaxID=209559 RepID=A0A8H6E625_PETAA|nr:low-affinity phosphate transporter [Aspergillus burnettii]
MPPRLNLFNVRTAAPVFRQTTVNVSRHSIATTIGINTPTSHGLKTSLSSSTRMHRRWNSSNSGGRGPERPKGPTEDPLPHVSEEAAEIAKIMDKKCDGTPASPELEQGTPISEILQRDKEAQKHMPKVMQDQIKSTTGTRSFSTSTRRSQAGLHGQGKSFDEQTAAVMANMISQVNQQAEELHEGIKFEPVEALPKTENFRTRYDSLLEQFTKLLMRDGKLSKAQKDMAFILDHLRTASPPQPNPKRPLLPGPPAPQLPLNPVLYLTSIVDSVAPLIKIRQQKGIAGGGVSVQIPVPLALRQRRRTAIKWIIDGSDKRRDTKFAQRVANELVAVAEGRSGVWDKREQQHKLGIAGRSNLAMVGGLARIASATSASAEDLDVTTRPRLSAQDIELVDYPVPPSTSTRARQSHIGSQGFRSQPIDNPQLLDRTSQSGTPERPDRRPRQARQHIQWDKPIRLKYWVEALHRRSRFLETQSKMKFSHSIQFNAVPEWSSYYIAYSNLKKLIYSLEQQVRKASGQAQADIESAPLLDSTPNTDAIFRKALDAELEKICSFYKDKELEILKEAEEVVRDAEEYASEADRVNVDPMSEHMTKARTMSSGSRWRSGIGYHDFPLARDRRRSSVSESIAEDDDDADSDDEHLSAQNGRRPSHGADSANADDGRTDYMGDSGYLGDSRLWRSNRAQVEHFGDPKVLDLYNSGLSLKKRAVDAYVSLCGLKSYIQLNKTGFSKALKKYDKTLDRSLRREYMNSTVALASPFTDSTMAKVEADIRKIESVYADVVTAGDLSLAGRELRLHLREHVVWERNTVWREMIGIERKAQAANVGIRRTILGGDEDPAAARRQGDEQEISPTEFRTPLGVFHPPQWLCSLSFGTLVFIVAIFVTLLSVPIMEKPEQQNCLAMLIFVSLLWATEVIPLFVTSLLIPFLVVLLRIMKSEDKPYKRLGPKEATSAAFSAMWTPVIMLLLGGFTIAAALSKYDIARRMAMFVLSKAGSSPHVVLLTNMFVSMFLSMWISNVASPVLCYSIIQPLLRNLSPDSNFAKALVLGIALAANVGVFTFHPGRGTALVPIRPVKDKFSGVQWFISIVTLSTIALWCGSHQLEHIFGDMGVIAIIPMVLFFGTGILNKEDFNNFLWTIIILAAGGLCLGKAVTSSGLLHTLANSITARVEHLSLYGVLIVFSVLILIMATFISHTVAALIILPLVRQIGVGMEDPHPNLLVMASALMCSVAMALPTSGFPNMTAIMTEVPQTGQRYLQVRHFFSRGIPASLMAWAVIVTLGYALMYIAGL